MKFTQLKNMAKNEYRPSWDRITYARRGLQRDFLKKNPTFDGVDSEMYKKALKVQILNEVAT